MKHQQKSHQPFIELPASTIKLTGDLVPAVRRLLCQGLTEDFMKSCVRIGAFDRFSGGLKAELVGGLRIDVHAVLKVGCAELDRHAALMTHVNSLRPKTFPLILRTNAAKGNRVFLLMEELRSHVTLLDKVFAEETTQAEFNYILGKVFEALRVMHAVTRCSDVSLASIPETPEPFVARLKAKLNTVFKADPELKEMMDQTGVVMGQPCPPLKVLLRNAAKVALTAAAVVPLRLVHGDPHLANIMVRRNGRTAYRVRLIDPNPEVGFSQPLYDIGKLLHWSDPVGWAKSDPTVCHARWSPAHGSKPWKLNAWYRANSAAAEKRRTLVESRVLEFAEEYRAPYGANFEPMLALATASAHLGLAAILTKRADQTTRRFVLANAMRCLAKVL